MVLSNLEPKSVFYYFEKLTQIPRESGNEKEVSDYCVNFAKERNLSVYQDEYFNVIIRKPGTKGYENLPTVIIQGHLDMVCEKNMDTEFDFDTEPLQLIIKDDLLMANGTTLGADNGVAVAYGLALLDCNDIPHPPLEVLLTTDEEVGMKGALKLDCKQLKGKYFINLDTEEEGELLVSCAGGLKASINLQKEVIDNKDEAAFKILIKGLKGGHSGMEIDKHRANSNKLMGRLLNELNDVIEYAIADIGGGLKDNAIPREAFATITLAESTIPALEKVVKNMEAVFRNEFKTSDPDIEIVLDKVENPHKVFSYNLKKNLLFLMLTLPDGIQTMSADIKDLVVSSLNFGVLVNEEDKVKLIFAIRSSVKSKIYDIRNQIKAFADFIGAEFIQTAEYPEWEYNKESKLRDLFIRTYEEMYGKKPLIKAIHAGLECGVFAEQIEGLDLISLGPDIFDVHTPKENFSISSVKRTWEYLLEALKNFKDIETFDGQ
ncbi:dipeptidase D [Natranaerovirga pectinivora]|uniref:Cytosol non-specific dipeptidase n=1 Tax=Natranaerovirga pectinivora TaxID=682400 RepID=A0A4V2V0P0_9FIRM|nr:aminoacyl-histidine dipeptidase [Natranaerovirga pectinivora]TCT17109.1 dipeptidase D [Natranaerovirga pectinivora]